MINEQKRKAAAPRDPAVCIKDSAAKQHIQGMIGDVRALWSQAGLLLFVLTVKTVSDTFDRSA